MMRFSCSSRAAGPVVDDIVDLPDNKQQFGALLGDLCGASHTGDHSLVLNELLLVCFLFTADLLWIVSNQDPKLFLKD